MAGRKYRAGRKPFRRQKAPSPTCVPYRVQISPLTAALSNRSLAKRRVALCMAAYPKSATRKAVRQTYRATEGAKPADRRGTAPGAKTRQAGTSESLDYEQ